MVAGNRRATAVRQCVDSRSSPPWALPPEDPGLPYRLRYFALAPQPLNKLGVRLAAAPERRQGPIPALPCSFVEERYESELTRAATVLDGVDRALERLSDGTYGQCETCGAPILEADLERDPTRQPVRAASDAGLNGRLASCPTPEPDAGRPSPSAGDRELLGGVEAGRHVGPVDDVPQRGEEVGLHVLVLQVEGVLPGVEDEERDRAVADVALVVVDLLDDQAAGRAARRPARPSPSPEWSRWPG